jgi:4'-phosphopantetheinyl transferase
MHPPGKTASPGTLTPHDVHVWYVFSDDVRDPQLLDRFAAIMTPEEHARRDRFVFAKDRHQFLVTRGVLRMLLARYLDADPARCAFHTDEYGRPSLCAPPPEGLDFNLSHTNGLLAIAVARVPEVGIDVEDVARPEVSMDLARRFFSTSEADALDALPPAARPSRFFDYWTLKEAYIKARGLGLSLPLDRFSMQLDPQRPPRINFANPGDGDPERWQFAQFNPSARHRLAVAVRGHLTITIRELDPSAI